MSSGWFDCTEPSLSTSLQGGNGVQGAHRLQPVAGVNSDCYVLNAVCGR